MNKAIEAALWEELKLLQGIFDKIDGFTFQIKNWFIGIFAALTAYAVVNDSTALVLLSIPLVLLFYFYELTYRVTQEDVLARLREVQEYLRTGTEPASEDRAPFVDKYILKPTEEFDSERLRKIQERLGVSDDRAERNLREWKKMFLEAPRFLVQFRVSAPYLGAVIIAILAIPLTCIPG